MLEQKGSIAYRLELPPIDVACMADNDNLINILLIEDDYSDSLLTIQRLNKTQIPYNLDRITRGDDVLPYLYNCMQTRLPDVLLLDMGLPGVDGFEILDTLTKAPAHMRTIPIAIITGHRDFSHLSTTYNGLPLYGCLTKPLQIGDIGLILSKVIDFKG
jgi:response regulator RpfG family c-di-GMP phosphodiesterase